MGLRAAQIMPHHDRDKRWISLFFVNITNLGELPPGDRVNFERAARYGNEIGGA
ncbi:MAG: hypothetical protein AB2551_15045 [Candidatus Thiodiazotropha sp.]